MVGQAVVSVVDEVVVVFELDRLQVGIHLKRLDVGQGVLVTFDVFVNDDLVADDVGRFLELLRDGFRADGEVIDFAEVHAGHIGPREPRTDFQQGFVGFPRNVCEDAAFVVQRHDNRVVKRAVGELLPLHEREGILVGGWALRHGVYLVFRYALRQE